VETESGKPRLRVAPGEQVKFLDSEASVVTVTATVMDGPVVRWYRTLAAAELGREYMSASRNGVLVREYLHTVPEAELDAAQAAHRALSASPRADVRDLATHRRDGLSGPLVPVVRPAEAHR